MSDEVSGYSGWVALAGRIVGNPEQWVSKMPDLDSTLSSIDEAIAWLEEQIPDRTVDACSDPDCRCSTLGDPRRSQ